MKSPVLQVSNDRWIKAQEFELKAWKRQQRRYYAALDLLRRVFGLQGPQRGDDWNMWWYEQFESYDAIPKQLTNALELGCGPYTNIRLIMRGRTIKHIVCSDPLADHYVQFKGRWLASEYARGSITVDSHPIEECPFANDSFDLVLVINVLDHVRDVLDCLNNAIRITRPTGYLVIGQDLCDETDVGRVGEDIGHPIRLHHEDLDDILLTKFRPILRKILPREKGRNPYAHYGTYLFIGEKFIVKSPNR